LHCQVIQRTWPTQDVVPAGSRVCRGLIVYVATSANPCTHEPATVAASDAAAVGEVIGPSPQQTEKSSVHITPLAFLSDLRSGCDHANPIYRRETTF
jgi:hypothetical protein